jgi:putative restriction endonuclease
MATSIFEILEDPNWDAPVFKKLPKNDSGDRESNQGGFTVNQPLQYYFPPFDRALINPENPTLEHVLIADLYKDVVFIETRPIRYQLQTWRATRLPGEARITAGANRDALEDSHTGDIVLMQRSLLHADRYRLFLIPSHSSSYPEVEALTAERDPGPLRTDREPISLTEIEIATGQIAEDVQQRFALLDHIARQPQRDRAAIARTLAFRRTVIAQYEGRCSVSSVSLISNKNHFEVEAIHIVPLSRGGPDDPRNGLTLSRTLHWAFDRGLFGFNDDLTIWIPERVRRHPGNAYIVGLDRQALARPIDDLFRVAPEAIRWHRDYVMSLWQSE